MEYLNEISNIQINDKFRFSLFTLNLNKVQKIMQEIFIEKKKTYLWTKFGI